MSDKIEEDRDIHLGCGCIVERLGKKDKKSTWCNINACKLHNASFKAIRDKSRNATIEEFVKILVKRKNSISNIMGLQPQEKDEETKEARKILDAHMEEVHKIELELEKMKVKE